MKKYHQFFSRRPRISIIMPSGRSIHFSGGMYVTSNEQEIEFLNAEVAAGHPMIYVKDNEKVITEEQLDPLAAVKKRAIDEYLAQQKRQQDPERDMGNSVQEQNLTTSQSIKNITIGSKSK